MRCQTNLGEETTHLRKISLSLGDPRPTLGNLDLAQEAIDPSLETLDLPNQTRYPLNHPQTIYQVCPTAK